MHTILSRLMGLSALKTVLKNIKKLVKNRQKNCWKIWQKRQLNLKKKLYEDFLKFDSISNTPPTYRKNAISKYCIGSEILAKNIMSKFFKRVSSISQWVFNTSKNATEYYAYNSVLSVESIKLLKQKWDKTEEGQNALLFIKLSVLSGI